MREFSDGRLFPTQFATVKEYGDDSYPYWFPMSIDGPIELEEGETLLWSEPLSDLSIPRARNLEWANWLCQLIAHQRLSEGVPLGPGAIDELNALQAGTSVTDDGALPTTFTWTLPGASERMNHHVRERLYGSSTDGMAPVAPDDRPKEWRETSCGLRIQFVDGRMTGRTCLVDPTDAPERQLHDLRQRWDQLPPSVIRHQAWEIEHGRSRGIGPGPDNRIALPLAYPSGAELLSGDASSLVKYLWPQVAADGSVVLGPAETAITSWTSYAPHGSWLAGTTESDQTGLVADSNSSNWRWTLTDRRLVLTYDMPIAESGHGGMQIHHDWACGIVARYQVFSGENQCLVALACGPGEKGAFAVWLNIGEPNQEVGDALLRQLMPFYSGVGRAVSPPAEWTEPKALGCGVVTKRYFAIAGGTGMTLPPAVIGTLVAAP